MWKHFFCSSPQIFLCTKMTWCASSRDWEDYHKQRLFSSLTMFTILPSLSWKKRFINWPIDLYVSLSCTKRCKLYEAKKLQVMDGDGKNMPPNMPPIPSQSGFEGDNSDDPQKQRVQTTLWLRSMLFPAWNWMICATFQWRTKSRMTCFADTI